MMNDVIPMMQRNQTVQEREEAEEKETIFKELESMRNELWRQEQLNLTYELLTQGTELIKMVTDMMQQSDKDKAYLKLDLVRQEIETIEENIFSEYLVDED